MSFCQHLSLIPKDDEIKHVGALIWEIKAPDNTQEDIIEYYQKLLWKLRRFFKPWCKNQNNFCMIVESIVIREHEPLSILMSNIDRLEKCQWRECPTGFEKKLFHTWLLETIQIKN